MKLVEVVPRVDILGSKISTLGLDGTVSQLIQFTMDGGRHYVCISNVHTVMEGYWNAEFARVTNEASLATPDGVPLVWASRWLHRRHGSLAACIEGRASGPDILEALLVRSEELGLRHYFYGSSEAVLSEIRKNLMRRLPASCLAGFLAPPVRPAGVVGSSLDAAERDECAAIDATHPHFVWVGLGAPKQEIWMHRVRGALRAPVLVGVGAAFDFLAGNKTRAPLVLRKMGLEWLHRMISEPKRLGPRYFKTNPAFVAAVWRAGQNRPT